MFTNVIWVEFDAVLLIANKKNFCNIIEVHLMISLCVKMNVYASAVCAGVNSRLAKVKWSNILRSMITKGYVNVCIFTYY